MMVSGRMQCLGSVQHLKGKFGGGYEVEVRCQANKVQFCMDAIFRFLETNVVNSCSNPLLCEEIKHDEEINGAELVERQGGHFKIRIQN